MNLTRRGLQLTSFQLIIAGFLIVIFAGTLLLMLPLASRSGQPAGFSDALFTSVSAVCVTGLVVRDTAVSWSAFGQVVILILIQAGGLGIISVTAFIAMMSGRKITLLERSMLQDTISTHQIGGVVKMTAFVFKVTLLAELAGAVLLMPVFCKTYGTHGIWMAVFHSISAFCNAGFDITGDKTGMFSSLTSYGSNSCVVIVICLLIIIGGMGFVTWEDIAVHRLQFHKYRMQSKVILSATALLILIPTAILFFTEYEALPFKEGIFLSLFQAVTPRTAGFNTADLTQLSGAGRMLFIFLMLVGGAPGSTAGGIKITTASVLTANVLSVFRRTRHTQLFGRKVDDYTVRHASALLLMYLFLTAAGAVLISLLDHFPVSVCLFEAVSAAGTVGLSLGITSQLGHLSRMILIVLMFLGRVGGLTLIYAASSGRKPEVSVCPTEKIIVG